MSTLDYAHRAKNIKNKPEVRRQASRLVRVVAGWVGWKWVGGLRTAPQIRSRIGRTGWGLGAGLGGCRLVV